MPTKKPVSKSVQKLYQKLAVELKDTMAYYHGQILQQLRDLARAKNHIEALTILEGISREAEYALAEAQGADQWAKENAPSWATQALEAALDGLNGMKCEANYGQQPPIQYEAAERIAALEDELKRTRELKEITEKANERITSQLATAKREGAVEELLRLADEWAASCEAEFFADWLRDRAAELEGK